MLDISIHTAELGEGLIATSYGPAWVDIEGRKVIWGGKIFALADYIPSVIFEANETHLLVGTHIGICRLFRDGRIELFCDLTNFDSDNFRLNDGCKLSDGSFLVGSMSRMQPEQEAGRVYRFFADGSNFYYDWPCHIPNSFIELDNGRVLITDSYYQIIYTVAFDGTQIDAKIWHQAEGLATPDGGCRLPDGKIALAMWDGACLRLFDQDATPCGDIAVPVVRPTNCLYISQNSGFYVTSARQGLDDKSLKSYPESGQCIFVSWPFTE